jgi:hypothetical protein
MKKCEYAEVKSAPPGLLALARNYQKTEKRGYFTVPNLGEAFLKKMVLDSDEAVHEFVYDDRPNRFFIDAEVYTAKRPMDDAGFEAHLAMIIARARELLESKCNVPKMDLLRVLRANNHREGKYSVHVTFPDVWFATPSECRQFLEDHFTQDDIDYSIYPKAGSTSPGWVRLPYSSTRAQCSRMQPETDAFYEYTCSWHAPDFRPPPGVRYNHSTKRQRSMGTREFSARLIDHFDSQVKNIFPKAHLQVSERGISWRLDNAGKENFPPCIASARAHSSNGFFLHLNLRSLRLDHYCLDPSCKLNNF